MFPEQDAHEALEAAKVPNSDAAAIWDESLQTSINGRQSFSPASVEDVTEFSVSCTRSMDSLTDLQVKKDCGIERLSKSAEELVPRGFLSTEDGRGDDAVLFFKPSQANSESSDAVQNPEPRKAEVTVRRVIRVKTHLLLQHKQMYADQAQSTFENALATALHQTNLSTLVNTACENMLTYQEFKMRVDSNVRGVEEGEEGPSASQGSGAGDAIVGVAAPALTATPARTSTGRASSGQGASPAIAAAGGDEKTSKGDSDDDSDDGGEDSLKHYKTSLPLRIQVLDSFDKRKLGGLSNIIKRLSKKAATKPAAATLQTLFLT